MWTGSQEPLRKGSRPPRTRPSPCRACRFLSRRRPSGRPRRPPRSPLRGLLHCCGRCGCPRPRPELLALVVLTAVLDLWAQGQNDGADTYSSATVKSMTTSWHNFACASFDGRTIAHGDVGPSMVPVRLRPTSLPGRCGVQTRRTGGESPSRLCRQHTESRRGGDVASSCRSSDRTIPGSPGGSESVHIVQECPVLTTFPASPEVAPAPAPVRYPAAPPAADLSWTAVLFGNREPADSLVALRAMKLGAITPTGRGACAPQHCTTLPRRAR